MGTRERKSYTEKFKAQMVKLYESGKPKNDILKQAALILGRK